MVVEEQEKREHASWDDGDLLEDGLGRHWPRLSKFWVHTNVYHMTLRDDTRKAGTGRFVFELDLVPC